MCLAIPPSTSPETRQSRVNKPIQDTQIGSNILLAKEKDRGKINAEMLPICFVNLAKEIPPAPRLPKMYTKKKRRTRTRRRGKK
jgi:hypothetical protein